ncbi:MAG: hypothetical protein LBK75_00545 [Oscillospiraceae bacterium]|jgi:hypothetical protein|nr:hypothetical protein [Oscillospiraceae bacterium]
MKHNKRKLFVFGVSLLAVSVLTISVGLAPYAGEKSPWFTQPETGEEGFVPAHNPYDTPEAWAELSTLDNLALVQIPEDELSAMPTVQLVKSCLNYVYFSDMYASSAFGDPFVSMVQPHFNGFSELFTREDRGSAILSIYSNLDIQELDGVDRWAVLRLECLYAMLRQYEILDAMTVDEKVLLLQTIAGRRLSATNDAVSASTFYSELLVAARCLNTFDGEFQQKVANSPPLSYILDMKFVAADAEDADFASETMAGICSYIQDNYGVLCPGGTRQWRGA